MKVKKYTAPTMPEAMQQIRKELGKDAIILNSKEIRTGGFLGLFKKKQLEVVAALDPNPIEDKPKPPLPIFETIQPELKLENSSNDAVLTEIKQLKQLFKQQVSSVNDGYPDVFTRAFEYLISQDVEETIAHKLIESTLATFESPDNLTMEDISQAISKQITTMLASIPMSHELSHYKMTYLVGPTGVGKTTTVAKLAAKAMLEDKKDVAFITADTYRIAAIDQLKTYAKILDIPIEVSYSNEDFIKASELFMNRDIIFVDTAGRNFKEDKYIKEIQDKIEDGPEANIILVLPLTGKRVDLEQITEQFIRMPIQSVLFTKSDETSSYGAMLSIMLKFNLNVCYIANGQDVPDDLFKPSIEAISKYVAGGIKHA